MKKIIGLGLCLWMATSVALTVGGIPLKHPNISLRDKASLQRGAQTFMTYCQTCHSLRYMRYNSIGQALGFPQERSQLIKALQSNKLLPAGAKPTDTILSPLQPEQALKTYGVVPPDLSLKVREKGVDWLFTYLLSFYQDPQRPSGVNNLLMPNSAMPNIMGPLQGIQEPRYGTKMQRINGKMTPIKEITGLKLTKLGTLSPQEFDDMVGDLVNFLDYSSEPVRLTRLNLGGWVVLFLFIFVIIAYFLKRAYWQDVH